MSNSMSAPWIRPTVSGLLSGLADEHVSTIIHRPRIVQVLRASDEYGFIIISDKENYITVMLTKSCADEFKSSTHGRQLSSLRNSTVKVDNWHLSTVFQCGATRSISGLKNLGVTLPLAINCKRLIPLGAGDCCVAGRPQDIHEDKIVTELLEQQNYKTIVNKLVRFQFSTENMLPNGNGYFCEPNPFNESNPLSYALTEIPLEQQTVLHSMHDMMDHSELLCVLNDYNPISPSCAVWISQQQRTSSDPSSTTAIATTERSEQPVETANSLRSQFKSYYESTEVPLDTETGDGADNDYDNDIMHVYVDDPCGDWTLESADEEEEQKYDSGLVVSAMTTAMVTATATTTTIATSPAYNPNPSHTNSNHQEIEMWRSCLQYSHGKEDGPFSMENELLVSGTQKQQQQQQQQQQRSSIAAATLSNNMIAIAIPTITLDIVQGYISSPNVNLSLSLGPSNEINEHQRGFHTSLVGGVQMASECQFEYMSECESQHKSLSRNNNNDDNNRINNDSNDDHNSSNDYDYHHMDTYQSQSLGATQDLLMNNGSDSDSGSEDTVAQEELTVAQESERVSGNRLRTTSSSTKDGIDRDIVTDRDANDVDIDIDIVPCTPLTPDSEHSPASDGASASAAEIPTITTRAENPPASPNSSPWQLLPPDTADAPSSPPPVSTGASASVGVVVEGPAIRALRARLQGPRPNKVLRGIGKDGKVRLVDNVLLRDKENNECYSLMLRPRKRKTDQT
eukprot:gene4255-8471_t